MTPGGRTWFMSSTRRNVESGVNGEGLMTTVQPTRMAGMMCQTAIISGQFHGVIDATTPTGLRRSTILPLLSSWMVSSGGTGRRSPGSRRRRPPPRDWRPGRSASFPVRA